MSLLLDGLFGSFLHHSVFTIPVGKGLKIYCISRLFYFVQFFFIQKYFRFKKELTSSNSVVYHNIVIYSEYSRSMATVYR